MGKALIIGAGGVAGVTVHKCCQNSDIFEEICILHDISLLGFSYAYFQSDSNGEAKHTDKNGTSNDETIWLGKARWKMVLLSKRKDCKRVGCLQRKVVLYR